MDIAAKMGCELAKNQPIAYKPSVVPSTAASFKGSRLNQPSSSNFFRNEANAGSAAPGRLSLLWTPDSGKTPYAVGMPDDSDDSSSARWILMSASSSSPGPAHVGSMARRLAAVSSPLGP